MIWNTPFKTLFIFLAGVISMTATASDNNPRVQITTNKGDFVIELYPDKAPESVKNFLGYVSTGFYDGTTFHRVIPNFMIQGGGFKPGFEKKETLEPIKNEADNGLENDLGTVAMARTNMPHSATSQFFINTKDNDFLNHTAPTSQGWGYAVFGKVVEGMETVKSIEGVETGNVSMYQNVPLKDVIIEKALQLKQETESTQ